MIQNSFFVFLFLYPSFFLVIFILSILQKKVEKATTLETIKGHDGEIARLGTQIKETSEDLDNAKKELGASKTYQEKIKDECETKVPSFEERQERRKKEIDGLKNAMVILTGEEVAAVNEEE